jgi:hypothetical protein
MKLWLPRKVKAHYSTSDWDFGSTQWALDTVDYVSSPSSIEGTGPSICDILCRIATTLCLPQGAIITQVLSGFDSVPCLIFRSQAALDTADNENDYVLKLFNSETVKLYRRVATIATLIGAFSYTMPTSWTKVKVIWWNSYNLQNVACLAVRFLVYESGDFVQKGDDLYDTDNGWAASSVNRVGVEVNWSTGNFDDTEIWCPG